MKNIEIQNDSYHFHMYLGGSNKIIYTYKNNNSKVFVEVLKVLIGILSKLDFNVIRNNLY